MGGCWISYTRSLFFLLVLYSASTRCMVGAAFNIPWYLYWMRIQLQTGASTWFMAGARYNSGIGSDSVGSYRVSMWTPLYLKLQRFFNIASPRESSMHLPVYSKTWISLENRSARSCPRSQQRAPHLSIDLLWKASKPTL